MAKISAIALALCCLISPLTAQTNTFCPINLTCNWLQPLTAPSVNSALQIGPSPGQYATIQACLNQCGINGGGVCETASNYSETLTAGLVLKPSCVLHLRGSTYTINMGTNSLSCAGGTCNGAAIIADNLPPNGINGFIYAGLSKAFPLGDNGASTTGRVNLQNVKLVLNGAGVNASGIYLQQFGDFDWHNVTIASIGGAGSQNCFVADGSGASSTYTGEGTITQLEVSGCAVQMYFTGSGFNAANTLRIYGGTSTASAGTCIKMDAGSSGNIIDWHCESATLAINLAGSVTGNRIRLWNASNTTDYTLGASTSNNVIDFLNGAPSSNSTDAGTNNLALFQGRVMNNQLANGDIGSITNWGASPGILVAGTNSKGVVCITAGAGPGNPASFTLTLHGGASFGVNPYVIQSAGSHAAPLAIWDVAGRSPTSITFQYNGLPVNGSQYCVEFEAGPR